ncbi:MAG: hypothetical protein K5776_02030, partial [Lachnospiraceae bacterium]|nr:hypothetical protein [Lachnospiraceae bacterium]
MLIYNGRTICEGISEGRIKLCIHDFDREIISAGKINTASEIKRFEDAVSLTLDSIKSECEKIKSDADISGSLSKTDETVLKILESYCMILEDDEFKNMVLKNIKESETILEKSLEKTRDFFTKALSGNDEVFSSRTNDMYDLTDRLFHSLSHEEKNKRIIPEEEESDEAVILLTDSMSVSDVLKYDRGKIAGIVSMRDSKYSHAAILAKSMNAVMLTGIKIKKGEDLKKYENAYAAIDGYEGKIYIEPDEDMLISLRKKKEKKAAFFDTDGQNGEVNEDKKNKNEKADKYQDGNNCKTNQDNKNNKSDKGNQENLNSNKDKGNQDNRNNNKDKGNQDNQNSNNTMNENMTTDKTKRIKIYANICGMNCVNEAVKFNPDGIGLFRTEYLFMNASKPGEDEQFEVYKSILEKMNPLPVIIRTMDLGADKN